MHRRLLLASCLAIIGASLFVATALAGSSASPKSEATRGGTLRLNVSDTDYEYVDPALAYDSIGWITLYAVNMQLVNYPDKPANAGGNQLTRKRRRRSRPSRRTGRRMSSRSGRG